MPRLATGLRRRIGRRLQLLLALAVVAAALGAVTASGASFVSASTTTVQASTSALSRDTATVYAGDGQSAVAGTAVADAPAVYVEDGSGNPVAGLTVTFVVTGGLGSITGATAVTGDDGVAAVGSWTLGSTPGTNTLRATCAGVSGSPLTFTATGTSGPAVRMVLQAGDGQSATVGSAVPVDPSVKVTDAGGNPVPNVGVTFAVASGGGSLTGWNAKTDAAGVATVGTWKLGTAAGANTLTATSAGLTGSPVVFTATGTPGPASKMSMNAGNAQTVHVGTPVTLPPSVLVTDAYNNPVPGVAVAFTVVSGGGSITGAAATTDAAGIAAAGSWTLGTTAGGNTLTAAKAGLSGSPVTFTATGLTGSPTTITPASGNGQSATVATAVAAATTVRVTDTYGNPVAGVAVTFAVTFGGGSATGQSVTTNASGYAAVGSWNLGTTAGANTLTATSLGLTGSPVTFTATGTAGASAGYVVSSSNYSPPIGSSVTITAQLVDQYNNPIATLGVPVTFSKTPTGSGALGGASPSTNAAGTATVTLTTDTTVGTVYAVTATSTGSRTGTTPAITTIAGTPAKISLYAGNNQSATVNATVATAPSVLVTDAYNNPVSGVAVTFAVASGGGAVTGASATTTASGIATLGSWRLGTTVGTNTLTATCAGLSGSPVTFTATGLAGPATKYVVTTGDYNPAAGTAVAITAQLADQYGNPVATSGIRVRFSKSGTGGYLTATRVKTNASGVATTTFYTSTTPGRVYTITARSTSHTTRTGTSAPITTR